MQKYCLTLIIVLSINLTACLGNQQASRETDLEKLVQHVDLVYPLSNSTASSCAAYYPTYFGRPYSAVWNYPY